MHHVARGRTPAGSKRGHAPAVSKREPSPAGSEREPSPPGSKRRRLLSGSALLGTLAVASTLFPAAANAQCAPDPATTGDNVICSGTDTDGIYISANEVSLAVEDGAVINSENGWGVFMAGDNNVFANRGTIRARVSSFFTGAVTLSGSLQKVWENTVTGANDGDISSIDASGAALELRNGVLRFHNREGGTLTTSLQFTPAVRLSNLFSGIFENSGAISAENGNGIVAFTSASDGSNKRVDVINRATGSVRSLGGAAIANFGGDRLFITNEGEIVGAVGVEIGRGSSVTNSAGGVIEGTAGSALHSTNFTGMEAAAYFSNQGIIRGQTAAVSGGSYVLDNSGDVYGSIVGAFNSHLVTNTGRIYGAIEWGSGQDALENTGTIDRNVSFGGGSDLFRDVGGAINGSVDLGDGDDFVLVKSGTDRTSIAGTLNADSGMDSFGYSVSGTETVTLETVTGYEGFAIEAREADSVATINAASLTGALSAFGRGVITNKASFTNFSGDALRLYSDGHDGINIIATPYGPGVTFINEGLLYSTGGLAVRAMEDALSGAGADAVVNRGNIYGSIALGSGSDRLENELLIIGDITTGGAAYLNDDDFIRNSGEIQGIISTGTGNDTIINGGRIIGTYISLGDGNDEYLIDLDATMDVFGGPVDGGLGYDAYGFATRQSATVSFSPIAGFELGAARADAEGVVIEVTPSTGAGVPGIRTSGAGTVINYENFIGFESVSLSAPAAIGVADLTRLENYGSLGGARAILANGENSTVINHADLTRNMLPNESSGNTGVIHDYGLGTTLINNGNIKVNAPTAGVFIGESTFGSGTPSANIARSTFTNNGRISSTASGLNINTPYGADIINHGSIDDILAERSIAGISITNSATGILGAISVNGYTSSSDASGAVTIANDGRVEVTSGAAISFRDYPSRGGPNAVYDDHVTNSGTIIGDIFFYTGADTFTVVGDGSVVGRIDGGADSDTVFIQDLTGLLEFDDFINFETIDISSTTTNEIGAASGDLSVFERLNIRSGATTLSTDIAITAEVDNGATLTGSGVTTGNLSIAGVLAPAPGAAAFRVGGDLTLADTTVIDLRVTENAASRLVVDGAATLAGARVDYTVENRPLLDLDLDASLTFNGQRTGTFSSLDFFNSPTSRTTIGANAGFNGLFDRLAIRQGLVLVQSELRGDVYVGAAGVLGGNGTIVGDVTADGVIAPGASIGALTINGDLILGPASTLAIETDADGTDLLTVTGNANLGGALVLLGDTGATTRKRSFQFLDVGGSATGTFDSIALSSGLSALNTVSIGPDGSVSLVVTPQLALNVALDPAAQDAASYFNALIANDQGNAATDAILTALAPLAASPAALEATLRSLQPETYAASIHAGARQALTVADTIRPRTSASQRGEGFSAWLTASDGSSDVDANPARGLSGHSTDTTSTIGGVEYAGPGYLFGGYGGAIQTDQSLAAQSTSADGVALGAYAALDLGPIRSSLNVGYIDSDATARRSVAALGETVTAEHDLKALTAQADLSASLALGSFSLTPLVGAVFAHVERGSASEAGGNAALDIEENDEDFLFLDAGATLARSFELGGGVTLSPSIWAGWRHELLAPSVSARGGLRGTSTNGLYTLSAQPDRSRLALRAALDVVFSEMVSASVGYEGEFGDTADTSAVSGTLNLRF